MDSPVTAAGACWFSVLLMTCPSVDSFLAFAGLLGGRAPPRSWPRRGPSGRWCRPPRHGWLLPPFPLPVATHVGKQDQKRCSDEYQLRERAGQQRCCGFTTERESSQSCVDVGRENRHQKQARRMESGSTGARCGRDRHKGLDRFRNDLRCRRLTEPALPNFRCRTVEDCEEAGREPFGWLV